MISPSSATFYFDESSPLSFTKLNNRLSGLPLANLNRRRSLTNTWFDSAHLGVDIVAPGNRNLSLA